MTITTRLHSLLFGQLVGTDDFGNRYYRHKGRTHGRGNEADKRRKEKRWVIYNGLAEPSKVPPQWHGWLHYTHDMVPADGSAPRYKWMKPHLPNLTGTSNAYAPPGHLLKGAQRSATTSDYEAWKP